MELEPIEVEALRIGGRRRRRPIINVNNTIPSTVFSAQLHHCEDLLRQV
jgi:hypothetical protein